MSDKCDWIKLKYTESAFLTSFSILLNYIYFLKTTFNISSSFHVRHWCQSCGWILLLIVLTTTVTPHLPHPDTPPTPTPAVRKSQWDCFIPCCVDIKVNEMKVGSRKPAPLVCDCQRCLTINLWPFFDLQDMTQSWPTQKAFGGNQTLFPNDAKLPSTHQKQSKFSLPHPMSGLLETFPCSFVVFWVASRPVSPVGLQLRMSRHPRLAPQKS